jgi:sporulation and spore germination protein/lipoprotein LpqB-like beta-propeller protein
VPSPRMLVVAGLVAVLAGCAGVPESGSVHVGRSLPGGSAVGANDIRVDASPPFPGESPSQIVNGFFNALVDNDGGYAVAKSYLAPGVPWHTATSTTLYDNRSTVRVSTHSVRVVLRRLGTVDSRGDYRVAPATLKEHFTVVRSVGQWRISHLPPGILLSTSDAQRTLQPATIYFFNRAETRLVPEPVLVPPDTPGLATTLIRELIAGPSRALAPGVLTAVPSGTGLLGTVPIDVNGVAEVDLNGSVQQVSPAQFERLSAQIVWTLRQLTAVTAVRLLVNGAPLSVPGIARVQQIGSWPQFDPATPPTARGALLSDHGRLIGLGRSVPVSLSVGPLIAPAVSADGTTVAALRPGRHRMTLMVGSALGTVRARLSGPWLSAPAFDPQGDVVVISGVGARSRLMEVPVTGAVRPVLVPRAVRRAGISAMTVSRDGSRIAMVVGPVGERQLLVGALTSAHGGLAVEGINLVIPGSSDVSGVAWAGGNEIVTTVRASKTSRVVLETGVDGYEPQTVDGLGAPADPTQVAAAPDQRMLVVADGAVWMLAGSRWQRVHAGQSASYAG